MPEKIKKQKLFLNYIVSAFPQNKLSEMIWVLAGQVINLLFGFALVKIISTLGTHVFGEYSLLMTIAALLGMIFYGPVTQGFLRYYYHYDNESRAGSFVRLVYDILFYSSLIVLFLSLILSFYMSYSSGWAIYAFMLFGFFIVLLKLTEFFNSFLNLLRKRKENSILQAIEKILIISLLAGLLASSEITLYRTLAAYSCVMISFITIKFFYLRKLLPGKDIALQHSPLDERKKMFSTLLTYVLPFLIWGLTGWLQLNSEKWIMAELLSTKDVGIYAVMMSLISAFVIVPNTTISDFASPIIFQKFSNMTDKDAINAGVKNVFLSVVLSIFILIFSVLLTLFFGEQLILLISSPDFTIYYYLLPLLVLGAGLFYIGQTFCFLGMGLNKPKKYLFPKVLVGILSPLLNFYFINFWGINGVAYSTLVIGFIYLVHISIINLLMLKELKKQETLTEINNS